MEQWRPIPDFPGYDVSNHGRVRSYFRAIGNRSSGGGMGWQIADTPQRVLRPSVGKTGYCHVNLCRDGEQHGAKVHKLVLSAFAGAPLPGFECAHNNSNPSDNRLSNLRYDTPWGNAQDQRLRDGEPPEIWVPKLRQERAEGASLKELATKYHYAPGTIWSICRGLMYAKCGGPIAEKRNLKLTDDDIINIRRRVANGEMQRRLAEEYGVHESTISIIKTGKRRIRKTDQKL